MNRARIVILSLLTLLVVTVAAAGAVLADSKTGWHAGIAKVDITPEVGLWMAGYASRDHAAEGTLHPLWAKSLVLQDDEGNRGVIVTSDVLGFPRNLSKAIKSSCLEKYGLDKSRIILSSSHTHSGPVLRKGLYDIYSLSPQQIEKIESYSRLLTEQIVELIGRALENLQPVELMAANGVVRFQVNRRNNPSETLSRQTDLNGPNDYAVPVLRAVKPDGSLAAVLFGYACHATVLNGYEWCGDYPGFAQIELEREFPGATALFFQGCGADQNPLPRRAIGLAQQYGKELAAAVESVVSSPDSDTLASSLEMAYEEIELEMASPPDTSALRKLAQKENGLEQRWAKRMLRRIEAGEALEDSYPYPVQVWKIGDLPMFVLGGEVVVDYAIQLKRIFGERTMVMGYANDVMAYIPSVRILREGGYEGLTSQIVYGLPSAWRADIENRIMDACIRLAKGIKIEIPDEELVSP